MVQKKTMKNWDVKAENLVISKSIKKNSPKYLISILIWTSNTIRFNIA